MNESELISLLNVLIKAPVLIRRVNKDSLQNLELLSNPV